MSFRMIMSMERDSVFMNLMTDFAFKHLFGTKENKHILIRFLNILFAGDNINVKDVVYHDKEVLPDNEDGKRILYDVYCTTPDSDVHFILEMQQLYHDFFENRTVFYTSKALSSQLYKGDDYDLNPVYSIFLVDFHFDHMTRKDLHDVRLMDIRSHEIYSEILRLLFVHLSEAKDDWDECKTEYDKIVFLIKNMHKMDKESKAYKSGEYDEIFREAEINNLVMEDAVAYSQSKMKYYDDLAAVSYASRKSREEGREEGRIEGKEDMIVKMYINGIDLDTIALCASMPVGMVSEFLAKKGFCL